MDKRNTYNTKILNMISDLVGSCLMNWQNRLYSAKCYGQNNLEDYYQAIKKMNDVISRGVENITEDEVYWTLLHTNGRIHSLNGQIVDRCFFAKRLYNKLNKLRSDSLNNNNLVQMLKNSELLRTYISKLI